MYDDSGSSLQERSLAVVAIAIAGLCTLPTPALWHFAQGIYSPVWTLFAVAIVVVAMPAASRSYEQLERRALSCAWGGWPRPARWLAAWGLMAVIVAVFFALASSRDYGDAGRITSFVSEGAWFHKRAPLSIAYFQLVHRTAGHVMSWGPRSSVQLASATAGALGVWAAVGFARMLIPGRPLLAGAASAATLSAGAVLLFFGHVEHYALPAALAMTFVYLGTRALLHQRSAVSAAAVGTLAAAVHLSMLTLVPALLFLVWHRCLSNVPWRTAMARLGAIAAVTVIPALLLLFTVRAVGYLRADEAGFGGGDGMMFVPLSDVKGMARYLLFRPEHLRAIANEQLLVAPLALVSCTIFGVPLARRMAGRARAAGAPRPLPQSVAAVVVFVALAALDFFGLTLFWNPDLGPFKDWDLFAPAGFLLSMLAAALITVRFVEQPHRGFACLLLVFAVNAHRTIPWLFYNLGL